VVLDAWSRKIVGWSMANFLRTELVLDALEMAIGQRPEGVIHHSDQISAKRCTTLSGARGSTRQLASRSAKPSRRSISRSASKPPSDDSRPPSNRATTALP
jgi:transposase InsO family protein